MPSTRKDASDAHADRQAPQVQPHPHMTAPDVVHVQIGQHVIVLSLQTCDGGPLLVIGSTTDDLEGIAPGEYLITPQASCRLCGELLTAADGPGASTHEPRCPS